jgi:hypothetical protein
MRLGENPDHHTRNLSLRRLMQYSAENGEQDSKTTANPLRRRANITQQKSNIRVLITLSILSYSKA